MKVYQTLLKKDCARSAKMLSSIPVRAMSGGGKIHKLEKDVKDFDIVLIGGLNATALTKFLQNDHKGWKMAIVTDRSKFVCPELYFLCSHSAIKPLKLESGSVGSQVDASSRVESGVRATKVDPENNKVVLSNGKEYTYKTLVYAPGFEHTVDNIPGLRAFEDAGERAGVYSHIVDTVARLDRNYYHGWEYESGDYIVYDPASPFKGEGSNFYPLYYEYILRNDFIHGRASKNARIQYWTPNKEIFKFPFANEVALEECHKRGIDVHFGWELIEVKTNEINEKIGVFRCVDTGKTIEKEFSGLVCNPPHRPQNEAVQSGLTDANGLLDVNPYTLQHKTYENVFAFGSATNLPTTRTQHATMAQSSIVKHNVQRFLEGKSLNAIYDGYTYMPLLMGQNTSTSFTHLYDYEPHWKNYMCPPHGIFGRLHFKYLTRNLVKVAGKYTGFKKSYGPPHWQYNPRYDETENNEYLQRKGISPKQTTS